MKFRHYLSLQGIEVLLSVFSVLSVDEKRISLPLPEILNRHKWIWCLWDRASLDQRWKQQTRCKNFRLLIFLLIYSNLLYMFRATNSPILRSTFWLYIQFCTMHRYCFRPVPTLSPVGSNSGALYQTVYTVKKCSWGWASLSPKTCRADLKR